ncbi:LacI family DNA-binding transcriptional regulator [Prauserella cavernicola]|uniref:LacI family DNA-binding transcriptional regulator n=1 Tax=Prauserella cavernicola TaxID=2800127 RepID=A0A934QYI5_9PSEU|nr:LacI family DNA-binding transcriptional regulator [Prauserella cavernicola]MBK1787634.1 LacI family DNA-binding transcriptional regulator [Prauserella cavernicola]
MGSRLRDVAQLAGVSVKTVSNVVNGYQFVSAATRSKVEAALRELDYRPNVSARNLRRGRSGMIAVGLPSIRNAYFAELAQLLVKEAESRSLTVLIDCTDGVADREHRLTEGFHADFVDGVILCPWRLTSTDLTTRRDRTPLVLLGERLHETADSVGIDSRAAARAATEHLLERRCARIGLVMPPRDSVSAVVMDLRRDGYREAIEAAGHSFTPELIAFPPTDGPADVAAAVEHLLAAGVDGLFCFNDDLGLAAMRAARARGYRVPEDVAVIGIDDIAASRVTTPTLSTVAPDKEGIARSAVAALTRRIDAAADGLEAGPPLAVSAEFTVVARESTRR